MLNDIKIGDILIADEYVNLGLCYHVLEGKHEVINVGNHYFHTICDGKKCCYGFNSLIHFKLKRTINPNLIHYVNKDNQLTIT